MRTYRWTRLVFAAVAMLAEEAAAAPCLDRASSPHGHAVSEAQVALCFEEPVSCWAFDLATKTWAPTVPDASERLPGAVPRVPAPPPALTTTLTANIRTCAADGKDCRNIDVPGMAAADSMTVIATADRSLVAMYGWRGPLRVFDGKTAKLLGQVLPWKTEMGVAIHSAVFLGETLLVLENDSPVTSATRLYTRTGVKLGNAGRGTGMTDDAIAVAADEWAFTTLEDGRVYIDNVKTGKHVARIDSSLGKAPQLAGVAILHRTADGKTLVVASGEPVSGVVLYDIATHASKRFAPPVCK